MAKFIQRRRNIPVEVICKSEPMYHYLGDSKGGILVGAIQRIATMYNATEDNPEHRQVVESIFDNQIAQLEQDAKDYKRETDIIRRTYRKDRKLFEEHEISIPKNHMHIIGITHPIFHRVINVVHSLDNNMSALEILWLMGVLDEQSYKNAKMKLSSILSLFTNNVYKVTNQLRSTTEVRGNTRHQINEQIASAVQSDGTMTSSEEVELSEEPEMLANAEVAISALDNTLTADDENPLSENEIGQMLGVEALKESA